MRTSGVRSGRDLENSRTDAALISASRELHIFRPDEEFQSSTQKLNDQRSSCFELERLNEEMQRLKQIHLRTYKEEFEEFMDPTKDQGLSIAKLDSVFFEIETGVQKCGRERGNVPIPRLIIIDPTVSSTDPRVSAYSFRSTLLNISRRH